MARNILLTGNPGCGKTTLLRHILAELNVPAGGFYTEEVREEGARAGFRMVALDGQAGMLAHVTFPGPPRVGHYGVDRAIIDAVGTASINAALAAGHMIVIDEIGPMELFSEVFCTAVLAALDSDSPVLGTIVKRNHAFADRIKSRPDVTLINVTMQNRNDLPQSLIHYLHNDKQP